MANKVICWDLDDTLGNLERVGLERYYPDEAKNWPQSALRSGIGNLLAKFQNEGFRQVITTTKATQFAEEAMNRANLDQYFTKVFGREFVKGKRGKIYQPVADFFGISQEEAEKNMILVGNGGDHSHDIPVVSIEQQGASNYDTITQELILRRLNELGEGHFKRGFEKMYEQGQDIPGQLAMHAKEVIFNDNMRFFLEYRSTTGYTEDEGLMPAFLVVADDSYRRKMEPIE